MAKKQKTKAEKYQNIINLIAEGVVVGMAEYEKVKKKRRGDDSDMISTSEAGRITSRSRVKKLIQLNLLEQSPAGEVKTKTRYVSKKRLLDLDKLKSL